MIAKLVIVKISAVLDRRWYWQWKPCGDAQVSGVCLTGILLKTKSIRIWSQTMILLTKITRVWVQDGKVIPNAMTNMPGASFPNDIQKWQTWQICQVHFWQIKFKHDKYAKQIFGKKYSKSKYTGETQDKTYHKSKCKHVMDKHSFGGEIVQVSTRLTPSQTTFAVRPRYGAQTIKPNQEHDN